MLRKYLIRTVCCLLTLPFAGVAQVVPHALFSDHAVLQRNQAVPVWGLPTHPHVSLPFCADRTPRELVGGEVLVSSVVVPEPVAVRYGWANVPDGNLFSRAGLPASPFRSDVP